MRKNYVFFNKERQKYEIYQVYHDFAHTIHWYKAHVLLDLQRWFNINKVLRSEYRLESTLEDDNCILLAEFEGNLTLNKIKKLLPEHLI